MINVKIKGCVIQRKEDIKVRELMLRIYRYEKGSRSSLSLYVSTKCYYARIVATTPAPTVRPPSR
ncbi:hypothetical protein, partial [Photobacterium leiognathi]|uniref:hypothetical protein n=1 Tax=Photobacterium leiognathi TaxID=553611 RepID=UPI001E3843F8